MWTECWGEIDSETLPCHFTPRLSDVSNSFGYSIQFAYASGSGGGSGGPPSSWHQRTGATFHNAQVSGNPSQASVSYAYPDRGQPGEEVAGGLALCRFDPGVTASAVPALPRHDGDHYTAAASSLRGQRGRDHQYSRSVSGSTAL